MAWATSLQDIAGLPIEADIDQRIIPILLKIDSAGLLVDQLRGFGIEVISEEDEGWIIGASVDAFNKLLAKINRFDSATNQGTAYLWEIDSGIGWKREYVLSADLQQKLDNLSDDEVLDLDISIACNIHVPDKPIRNEGETQQRYDQRMERWMEKVNKRDEVQDARMEQFSRIVSHYGSIIQTFDYSDSFGIRAKILVKGLKDILYNYPYVFEIQEHDYLEGIFNAVNEDGVAQVQINAPPNDAPKVCIIDSGIMEGHRLLNPAIDHLASKNYVPGEDTVADHAPGGGHGTRVAGAALYPYDIPADGNINLPFWIQNARILNRRAKLSDNIFLPNLMQQIVNDFSPTKIYNLSVSSSAPCQTNHMSLWATAIDKLMWERDILFVVAVGNLFKYGVPGRPGIHDFIVGGNAYPRYLLTERYCRVANPAQSSFALSVGSVTIGEYEDDDRISFGKTFGNYPAPSPFSRTGPGLWGMIKPDVVEFGGDLVREKGQRVNIIEHHTTSPQLVKSIETSQEALGKDSVGTSYAAPKVAHIAAVLQHTFRTESCLFHRGLIVQSARLPDYALHQPGEDHLRHFGYGVPSIFRALDNNTRRVTLFATGSINAKHTDIYTLRIPNQIRRPGADFQVMIEVTLSYKASPRRTRKRTSSYLSTWLDWKSSKLGESLDDFTRRVINVADEQEGEIVEAGEWEEEYTEIPWKIRERGNWGQVQTFKRQDSTLQKDWAILEANALPSEFNLAVLGHRGWSIDLEQEVPYALFVSLEILNPEIGIDIYNAIRVENEIEIPVQVAVQV
ncbi:S8 family peptidase [Chitinophaga eiseniae]|uniref:S8 family peptidase n=1 Tax=Chitinophaga eiseniae TaxID=634771 RepID=UPI001F35D07F|nr:S8 family peptidase [Chitinophaga eiseniae]